MALALPMSRMVCLEASGEANMSEMSEQYLAVLEGVRDGEHVTYAEEVIASSNDDEAKIRAFRWASDLHPQIGEKAALVLKKGIRGVHSHEF